MFSLRQIFYYMAFVTRHTYRDIAAFRVDDSF
jgi:hypothetical protein